MTIITSIANSLAGAYRGRGSNFKKNSMGKMKPTKGFTVAPASVMVSLMFGTAMARMKLVTTRTTDIARFYLGVIVRKRIICM